MSSRMRKQEYYMMPDNCIGIGLTKGKIALIDPSDFELVSDCLWCTNRGYAHSSKIGLMHRIIMCPPPGMQVDHKNRNRTDNRRSNLRICTFDENRYNAARIDGESQYRGVSKFRDYWAAKVTFRRKREFLGYYHSEVDAATAYDLAAIKYFGEFANLNFFGEICVTPVKAKASFSSQLRGVRLHKSTGRWEASFQKDNKRKFLGLFDTEVEAHEAYLREKTNGQ